MQDIINKIPKIREAEKEYDFYTFPAQEFARKINDWTLHYYGVTKSAVILNTILPFLSKTRIIAGGAALYTGTKHYSEARAPDYDIFFIKKIPTRFLEKIRKHYNYHENVNCINIEYNDCKIQFIKRVYDTPAQVIGGFDLDPCRAFINHLGEIYLTSCGLYAEKSRVMFINPACQSSSMRYRIVKYMGRGYRPVHITNIGERWRGISAKALPFLDERRCDYYRDAPNCDLLYFLISGKINRIVVSEELKELSDLVEYYHESRYRDSYKKALAKRVCKIMGKYDVEYIYMVKRKIEDENVLQVIADEYENYKKITGFLITNPGRQFSASFDPTNYTLRQLYPDHNFNILTGVLRVAFLAVKTRILPRFIIYKIFRDYYDIMVLDN